MTSYDRGSSVESTPDWRSKPDLYKFYSYAPVIGLPSPALDPDEEPGPDVLTCIGRRRTVRSFGATPLSLLELSRLLWSSGGLTASFITPQGQDFYRAAPAAGALYPVETYLVVNKVEGLEPGLYHYRVAGADILERPIAEGSHSLEQLRTGDLRAEITAAALDQPLCGKAGVVFVWTAVFARSEWKYQTLIPLFLSRRGTYGRAIVPGGRLPGARYLPAWSLLRSGTQRASRNRRADRGWALHGRRRPAE
jgi:SagB-type dehydrogenase family enzyme